MQLIKVDGNRDEAKEWSDSVRNFTKISGKIKLLYGYLVRTDKRGFGLSN